MKRWLLFFLLLLLAIPALAEPIDLPSGNTGGLANISLTPPASDVSMRYLGYLFGIVDGVLHGSGTKIFGQIFGVFNAAVLALGAIIIGYVLIVSTLNTAQDGEVLGKKWSSIWIPLRSAVGVALLIPKASGYSLIQIMVMWIVVQGVGAADSLWGSILDYLKVYPLVTKGVAVTADSGNLAGDLLKREVCMYALQSVINNQNASTSTPLISFSNSVLNPSSTPGSAIAKFPDNQNNYPGTIAIPGIVYPNNGTSPDTSYYGVCGNISWEPVQPASTDPDDVNAANLLNKHINAAIQMMLLDIDPLAQQIVATDEAQQILMNGGPTGDFNGSRIADALVNQGALVTAASDYQNLMQGVIDQQQAGSDDTANQYFDEEKQAGWIMAGRAWFRIANLKANTASNIVSQRPRVNKPTTTIPLTNLVCPASETGPPDPNQCPFINGLNFILDGDSASGTASDIDNYIKQQTTEGIANANNEQGLGDLSDSLSSVSSDSAKSAMSTMTDNLGDINKGFMDLLNAQENMINPVFAIQTLGNGMINCVGTVWVVGAVIMFGLGAASACAASNPVFSMLFNFILWFIPLFFMIIILLFVAGATFAYYIPLVPFILLTFAGIGWLIGVIESMVAAPLVALGVTHPEGHEHWGKAEPAVMLILNIFIRPTLIIIGFIGGMLMSYIGVWLLNEGFGVAIGVWKTTGFTTLFKFFAVLIIYATLVTTIIHKAFSLIHVIPDEVLRWIGGGGKQFGEGQSEQEIRQGVSGGLQQMGGAVKSVGDKSIEGAGAGGAAVGKSLTKKDDLQVGKGSGGGGGGGSGNATGALKMAGPKGKMASAVLSKK